MGQLQASQEAKETPEILLIVNSEGRRESGDYTIGNQRKQHRTTPIS